LKWPASHTNLRKLNFSDALIWGLFVYIHPRVWLNNKSCSYNNWNVCRNKWASQTNLYIHENTTLNVTLDAILQHFIQVLNPGGKLRCFWIINSAVRKYNIKNTRFIVSAVGKYHRGQNGSGVHPASYPMGTGALSLGVKRPGREAEHSPPSSAEVKNAWNYTSTPSICLHGVVLS
jgi:hypothetical protein